MKIFAPIIMIFLVLTMSGCYSKRIEDKTLASAPPVANSTIKFKVEKYALSPAVVVVVIDSCEYLYGHWGSAVVLTYKGNCKYCKERNK